MELRVSASGSFPPLGEIHLTFGDKSNIRLGHKSFYIITQSYTSYNAAKQRSETGILVVGGVPICRLEIL